MAAAHVVFDLLRRVRKQILATIAPESDADAELFAAIDEVLDMQPHADSHASCSVKSEPTHIAVSVGESGRLYSFASVDETVAIEESRELCLGASEPWVHTYVLTTHLPPRSSITQVEGSLPKSVDTDSK